MARYISSKIMLAIVGLHGRHPRVVLFNRRVIHCHLLLHGLDVVYSAVGIFGSLTNLLRAHRTRRESLLVEAVFGLADRSLKHLAQRKGVRQERDGPLDGLLVLRVPEEVRQL